MKKKFLAYGLILSVTLQITIFAQVAIKPKPAALKAAETITAAQLSDYLHFIASDVMEGRDTPSRGLDTTAQFIGTMLSRWGFKPAGDNGTFYQKIALKSEQIDPAKNTLEINGQKAKLGEDFFRFGGSTDAPVSGPLVYAKDGWMIKSKNINAFDGIDVKNKIVVVYTPGFPSQSFLTALPQGLARKDLTGERGKDWADPVTNATQNGALGVILVASPGLQGAWGQVKQFLGRGNTFPEKLRPAPTAATPARSIPVMLVSQKIGADIFQGAANPVSDANAAAGDLKSTVTLSASSDTKTLWTQNVVAIWEGSDPILKNEMVAIGAHYDHVGTNPDAPGEDKIWNGADDDGSGTVAVLGIAEALAKSPKRPKRSVLFVWHAGEEKGLWGSEYFNKFPTIDIKKVVAQLNIDMIGRSKKPGDTNEKNKELSGENEIYVIGSNMMSSELGALTTGVNKGYLNMNYNFRYDDPKDPNRFFFRSDHFNYAVNGIPIAFWFDGVHEDYHGAGDHPDKIDYTKMQKVTRTIFMTLWELGEMKTRPKIDKQLPPELTQR